MSETQNNTTVSQDSAAINQVAQTNEADIVTKVAQFKEPVQPAKAQINPNAQDELVFNVNDIEKIQDPQARDYAMKAYKSFERGYQKKFQEVANMRKQAEDTLSKNNRWTPERLQAELQNPEFIQVATQVANMKGTNDVSEEEYSNLTDSEKARLAEVDRMKSEFDAMKRQYVQAQAQREHEALKSKYADYDPQEIEQVQSDLLSGRLQATKEHLFWAIKGPMMVEKAFRMGQQGRQMETGEKINSMSLGGFSSVSPSNKVVREKGESSREYMHRLFQTNLERSQQAQLKT